MSTDPSPSPNPSPNPDSSPPYPYVRDPAPHRGFKSKAREVLLDNFHGSDGELVRKMSGLKLNSGALPRTDSDPTTISGGSQKSCMSSQSCAGPTFDEIGGNGERPNLKQHKAHKLLGEIGRTRSYDSDLLKRQKGKKIPLLQQALQNMDIIKLPSFDDDDDDEKLLDNHSHKNKNKSASSLLEAEDSRYLVGTDTTN